MRVLHGCGDNHARNRRLANLACMCPERITMCDRTFLGIPYNFHRRCCCVVFNSMITRSGHNQFRFARISAPCLQFIAFAVCWNDRIIFNQSRRRIIAFFYRCHSFYLCIDNPRREETCVTSWAKVESGNAFDNKRTRASNPGSDNESRKRYNSTNICRKAMPETLCTGY